MNRESTRFMASVVVVACASTFAIHFFGPDWKFEPTFGDYLWFALCGFVAAFLALFTIGRPIVRWLSVPGGEPDPRAVLAAATAAGMTLGLVIGYYERSSMGFEQFSEFPLSYVVWGGLLGFIASATWCIFPFVIRKMRLDD